MAQNFASYLGFRCTSTKFAFGFSIFPRAAPAFLPFLPG